MRAALLLAALLSFAAQAQVRDLSAAPPGAVLSFADMAWHGDAVVTLRDGFERVESGGDVFHHPYAPGAVFPSEYRLGVWAVERDHSVLGLTFDVSAPGRVTMDAHGNVAARVQIGEASFSDSVIGDGVLAFDFDAPGALTLTFMADAGRALPLQVAPVPEPQTWGLLAIGLAGLLARRRLCSSDGL